MLNIVSKYAVLGGLVSILITYFVQMIAGSDTQNPIQYVGMLNYVVWGACIYLGAKERRDTLLDGSMTYGQGVGTGMIIILMISVLVSLFTIINFTLINPSLIDEMKRVSNDAMETNPKMAALSQAERDQAIAMAEKFQTPGFITAMAFLGVTFVGLILSLIEAFFTKKEKPLFDPMNNEQ